MRFFLLLIPFLMAVNSGQAEPYSWQGSANGGFSATITLSSAEISIEDKLVIQTTLTYPPTHHPKLDELVPNILTYDGLDEPPFHLFKEKEVIPLKITNEVPQDQISTQIAITITPQTAGKHFISLFVISFEPNDHASSQLVELITGVFEVNVTVPPLDFNPMSLMAPPISLSPNLPINISFNNRRKWIENATVSHEAERNTNFIKSKTIPWHIILAILAILLFYLIMQAPIPAAKIQSHSQTSPETPRQQSLKKLEALSSEGLADKGNYDVFFTRLDQIVRTFIEEYYQINAPALTTPEFLKKAATTPAIDANTRSHLSIFLAHTDRVKFAQYRPTLEECKEALQTARQFIRK